MRTTILRLSEIGLDPRLPRKPNDITELNELAQTIKVNGIGDPILVREDPDRKGSYFVTGSDEHIFRAAKLAKMQTIPTTITSDASLKSEEIEVFQPTFQSPLEEAEALDRIRQTHNYTHKELGKLVGRSRSATSNLLKLLTLPEEIKKEAVQLGTPKSILSEITTLEPDKQLSFWKEYIDSGLTVQDARRKKHGKRRSVEKRISAQVDKLLDDLKVVSEFKQPISDGTVNKLTRLLKALRKTLNET